jgi:hypothetical protein
MFKIINSINNVQNKNIFIFGGLMSKDCLLLCVKNSSSEGVYFKLPKYKIKYFVLLLNEETQREIIGYVMKNSFQTFSDSFIKLPNSHSI